MNEIAAWSAFAQALFAGAILVLTYWYARTTKHLLEIQVEPDLDCGLIPLTAESEDIAFTVRNNTVCSLGQVSVTISLPQHPGDKAGDPDVFRVSHQVSLGALGPDGCVDFLYAGGVPKWERNARLTGPEVDLGFFEQLLIQIRAQRRADAREFYWSYRYRILDGVDVSVIMQTHKQKFTTGRRLIVRKVGEHSVLSDAESFLEPKPPIDATV